MEINRDNVLALLKKVLPHIDFETSADLVDDDILDSLSIVTMISELSMEFGVDIDVSELMPDDLNSLDAITETVKKSAASK